MTARIRAAHRLGRKPDTDELNTAITDEVNATASQGQILADRIEAISEAAKNFAASDFKTYREYREHQDYLAGKSVLLAFAARRRNNIARGKASAEAYKAQDEEEWRAAMDEAGKNAGGRRRRKQRRVKTVKRRRVVRRRPSRRRV
jgi:hypothetical protein